MKARKRSSGNWVTSNGRCTTLEFAKDSEARGRAAVEPSLPGCRSRFGFIEFGGRCGIFWGHIYAFQGLIRA